MPHRLHFCLLAADKGDRIQVCRRGRYWLWPVLELAGRARLPAVGAQHLAQNGAHCQPRCVTYPTVQNPQTMEWLGLYEVDAASRLPGCEWVDLSALCDADAVLAYQGQALAWHRAGVRGTRPVGPFEVPGALDAIRTWVAGQLGTPPAELGRMIPYRLTAYEAVLGFAASRERVYFKAQSGRPFRDALVSQLLNRVAPGTAAPTRAWSETRGWWLIDHVEGLAATPLWDTPTALRLIETVAETQHVLRGHATELQAAGATPVSDQLLDAQLAYILQHVEAPTRFPVHELMQHFACARVVLAETDDRTWNHNDLAPQNIGVTATHITFIDHEAAAVGPALMTAPRLAQTCDSATGAAETSWLDYCTRRLTPPDTARTEARRARLAATAAVIQLALQSAHLRRSEANQECGSSLHALVLLAAERMLQRLRPPHVHA